jgi:aminoglycoside phosphotransferase (APT) family kinase protein
LHSDNVFAVLAPDDTVRGVAVIDWGSVESGRHPLSDVSKLMVDLAYRVQCTPEMRALAFDVVRDWGVSLGCDSDDWRVTLIHQLAKIMFYRYGADDSRPLIGDVERSAAWEDMRRLVEHLELGCRPAA